MLWTRTPGWVARLRHEVRSLRSNVRDTGPGILHELCHYAAARLLDVPARIAGDVTVLAPCPRWKNLTITLAPLLPIAGYGWISWNSWASSPQTAFHLALLALNSVIVVLSIATCYADLHAAACIVLNLPEPYPHRARRRRRRRAR